jgi:putative redox protein
MALFAHCFTCGADVRAAVGIARALAAQGFAVMTFDFTGLGESEGDFADTNFSTNVADLLAAARHLAEVHRAPDLLVGHSLGGTAVLAAAADVASCRAVATIGAPAEAAHVAHLLADGREEIESRGQAKVDIGGRPFFIKRQFLDDIARQSIGERLRGLRRALLVMHSPRDRIVSIDNAARIFEQALHPKSFVSLDDADHLLSREADAAYAARVLAAWAGRFLDVGDELHEDGVVARTRDEGFVTSLAAGRHEWLADEPRSVGGTDLGPTPYDLLGAALASCTSMTLQVYARRKGLALEEAIVSVTHDRIHVQDCGDCETKEGRVDRFVRTIELAGRLDDAARTRLLEIADRCPVHRTLTNEIRIESSLRER